MAGTRTSPCLPIPVTRQAPPRSVSMTVCMHVLFCSFLGDLSLWLVIVSIHQHQYILCTFCAFCLIMASKYRCFSFNTNFLLTTIFVYWKTEVCLCRFLEPCKYLYLQSAVLNVYVCMWFISWLWYDMCLSAKRPYFY